ncbi:MAG: hypothetical protein JNJ73_10410 [Hyphomonadaceae bacterium]|nr:hypothetical protein [Hyphomonadaceae bacterium]
MIETVIIPPRFCGPAASANGGYVCGLLAGALPGARDGAVEATLKAPPPLDAPLIIERTDGDARLLHNETEIAIATSATLDLDPPPMPSRAAAEAASARYQGFKSHIYPTCFVCGSERAQGDGLRIFTGPVEDKSLVAAIWTPASADCDASGLALPEIVWAALDCPGYFALQEPMPALLGRMRAHVRARPRADEHCVVVGWRLGQEGRKHFSATAIYGDDARLIGLSQQTWIELPRERVVKEAVNA